MPFNSAGFICFLYFSAVGFYLLPSGARTPYLAAVSFLFYAFWSPAWALLLLAAVTWAWGLSHLIARAAGENRKKALVGLGVSVLVASLAALKFGPEILHRPLAVAGLSYYTFKLIGYLLDVYWGKIPAEKKFTAFAAYAAFFPQIASGPIQRAGDFLSQARVGQGSRALALAGLRLVLWGFFKKLVIADRLAVLTENVFSQPSAYPAPALWIAAYAFFFQLYADFSGITDIAIGAGKLFGITAPDNFNRPYLARNVQDFWRRWHITLTSWITDYLFTPMRMALRGWGDAGLAVCIAINMMVIATWHGAAAHYLVFGIFHAAAMIVSALTLKKRDRWFAGHPVLARGRAVLGPLVTFHLVVLSFVFFKADVATAMRFVEGMLAGPWVWRGWGTGLGRMEMLLLAMGVALMEIVQGWRRRNTGRAEVRVAADYAVIGLLLGCGVFTAREFIYFKF